APYGARDPGPSGPGRHRSRERAQRSDGDAEAPVGPLPHLRLPRPSQHPRVEGGGRPARPDRGGDRRPARPGAPGGGSRRAARRRDRRDGDRERQAPGPPVRRAPAPGARGAGPPHPPPRSGSPGAADGPPVHKYPAGLLRAAEAEAAAVRSLLPPSLSSRVCALIGRYALRSPHSPNPSLPGGERGSKKKPSLRVLFSLLSLWERRASKGTPSRFSQTLAAFYFLALPFAVPLLAQPAPVTVSLAPNSPTVGDHV